MNAPAKISERAYVTTRGGDTVDLSDVLAGIGDALEEVRAHLQKQIDGGKKAFTAKEVIKAVGSELGELERKLDQSEQARRDLQDQVDHLRDVQRSREVDWIDDVQELKRLVNTMSAELHAIKSGKVSG
jgi:chromosome segregation ATPase